MRLEEYSVEDFVCDESFQNFCRGSHFKDVSFWIEWIEQNPSKKEDVHQAIHLFHTLSVDQRFLHRDYKSLLETLKAKSAFIKRMDPEAAPAIDYGVLSGGQRAVIRKKQKIKRRRLFATVAAAMVIIVLASLAMLNKFSSPAPSASNVEIYSTISEDKTMASERKTVFLPDGSVVVLSVNSEITIDAAFSPENRKTKVTGEAYFDIHHDPDHPFYLDCHGMKIKVLGTRFTVKAYPDQDTLNATLIEGQIEITYSDQNNEVKKILLKSRQQFLIKKRTDPGLVSTVRKVQTVSLLEKKEIGELSNATSWAAKKLSFENEALTSIAKKLEDWYGVTIKIEDEKVKDYRYTGTFENENVRTVLLVLSESYPFHIKTQGNMILINE